MPRCSSRSTRIICSRPATKGERGCEGRIDLFERLHADPTRRLLHDAHLAEELAAGSTSKTSRVRSTSCIEKTNEYIDEHCAVARSLGKPIVIEEYGFPREGHSYELASATDQPRQILRATSSPGRRKNRADGGPLAGCNFWTFGGTGRPSPGDPFWSKGEDLLGDPPQEEQGLNSVFDVDTTIEVVDKYNRELGTIGRE